MTNKEAKSTSLAVVGPNRASRIPLPKKPLTIGVETNANKENKLIHTGTALKKKTAMEDSKPSRKGSRSRMLAVVSPNVAAKPLLKKKTAIVEDDALVANKENKAVNGSPLTKTEESKIDSCKTENERLRKKLVDAQKKITSLEKEKEGLETQLVTVSSLLESLAEQDSVVVPITIPAHARPGKSFVAHHHGIQFRVVCPLDAVPGQEIRIVWPMPHAAGVVRNEMKGAAAADLDKVAQIRAGYEEQTAKLNGGAAVWDTHADIAEIRSDYEEQIANLNDEKRELLAKHSAAMRTAEQDAWDREKVIDRLQGETTTLQIQLMRAQLASNAADGYSSFYNLDMSSATRGTVSFAMADGGHNATAKSMDHSEGAEMEDCGVGIAAAASKWMDPGKWKKGLSRMVCPSGIPNDQD